MYYSQVFKKTKKGITGSKSLGNIMKKYRKIANNAIVKNSKINSPYITINSKAKLEGVIIKAKKLTIGTNSTLTDCKIFSDGEVIIGKNSTIKEESIINVFKKIKIGDRCIIDRGVFIGGMQSEESEIEIGDDCAILYRSFINPTKKITLGNNVGIGGYSQIFTHGAWQNVLLGYPNKFEEITIKDNVWIPWNVMVLPGVTIGENAVIGAGSVITKNIPKNVFAGGNPAEIKRKNLKKKNPTKSEKNKIILKILENYHSYAQNFLNLPNTIQKTKNYVKIIFKDNSQIIYSATGKIPTKDKKTIFVSFKIPEKDKSKSQWIELDSLTVNVSSKTGDNFASFIKRYGIRLIS